jgi:hypothetical protein
MSDGSDPKGTHEEEAARAKKVKRIILLFRMGKKLADGVAGTGNHTTGDSFGKKRMAI